MAGWSGAVKLGDLDDFIAPSQSCVVSTRGTGAAGAPVKLADDAMDVDGEDGGTLQSAVRVRATARSRRGKGAAASAEAEPGPAPSDRTGAGAEAAPAPVKISLHDCLACAGCITSAETVLLEHQSAAELRSVLAARERVVVVSVAPQARASLASHFGITPRETFERLTGYFKTLGVRAVFDTTCSRDLTLLEAREEFVQRYRAAAASASTAGVPSPSGCSGPLPVIASACPGWVCYAEKSHSHVLPHLSTVKSPQQVMATLVKRHVAPQLGVAPAQIYHVAVMPCYDKKLEASREDFRSPADGSPETDCVLTAGEVLGMLEEEGVPLTAVPPAPVDAALSSVDEATGELFGGVGGGSGGYIEAVFRHAAAELFGRAVPPGPLQYRQLRNADLREVTLEVDGAVVLRFCAAYGFRNIQNLVRQIKQGRSPYHYVEIMACPSGCLNGGGQVKAPAGGALAAKQLLERVEAAYHAVAPRAPEQSPAARRLYDEFVLGPPCSANARTLLHTQFHARTTPAGVLVTSW
mmetsp:Transcript_18436/g.60014  ORF Transcript_18436/g.60014 Transcript_18436/m.60014 type:complete len:524 (+) Transcript_18436:32-1603(+)|eukprot:CAMPEP_0170134500 /NCGR_PEP_ID=MMETSP0033_2-20121228/1936_1 /TAXON_ID=195969 /ORGANISM="Dolichomastix tenuilepis, Strain CCMP3274" /LENGTH=523 /DNA_ID=CAMNT_0010370055 /DNA_START=13 /DNA_END=1584 /DNA_ORIENTATION=+